MMLRAERQSARMSKITNDGLARSGTGCFMVGVKGLKCNTFTVITLVIANNTDDRYHHHSGKRTSRQSN